MLLSGLFGISDVCLELVVKGFTRSCAQVCAFVGREVSQEGAGVGREVSQEGGGRAHGEFVCPFEACIEMAPRCVSV